LFLAFLPLFRFPFVQAALLLLHPFFCISSYLFLAYLRNRSWPVFTHSTVCIHPRTHFSPIFLLDVSALRNVGTRSLTIAALYPRRTESSVWWSSGVWRRNFSEEIFASVFRV
jgi:hypothetical protein